MKLIAKFILSLSLVITTMLAGPFRESGGISEFQKFRDQLQNKSAPVVNKLPVKQDNIISTFQKAREQLQNTKPTPVINKTPVKQDNPVSTFYKIETKSAVRIPKEDKIQNLQNSLDSLKALKANLVAKQQKVVPSKEPANLLYIMKKKATVELPTIKKPPPVITTMPQQILPTNTSAKNADKTVIKNSTISSVSKLGNIDTKGKLSVANVKVAEGSTLKDTTINANVKTQNISVSKGSSADIGNVNIEK